ncbi:hypothetical protein VNI00_000756 [Paramarasmius palmivorus]|uniref:Chitinase n=1 Tax=Paramarasmius palmivorus TaxID=297713 RepID=A0AAW0E667_9AGAR
MRTLMPSTPAMAKAETLAYQFHEAIEDAASSGTVYPYPCTCCTLVGPIDNSGLFSPGKYGGGAYLTVHNSVGSLIDWYNVQFYNQGTSEYTTCSNLLTTSSNTWPKTALFQIAASGVPLSKLVIGKPATTGDANNGYIDANTLATCLQTAKNQGWNGGAMAWQYPHAGSSWITTVRSKSWPV